MKSVFFVPVFNQLRELPGVLAELRASGPACDTVLLVNNGSSDGSEALVRASGYPYLDLPRNQGVGYSYMLALDWALARGFEVFGTMASNGKMLPSEMPRLLDPVLSGEADHVTGSRFLAGGASPNLPAFRRRSIPWVNLFVRLCTGATLTDATCGYRAFRLDLVRRADFDWHAPWLETYGLEYYLYAKVLLDPRLRWLEVPVTMRYPQAGPYSKIRAGRDWLAMLKPWLIARLDRRGFRAPEP
ncbi:MAG TPA: glycosyltransferase family 2 protein [Thermoanaerobaculia bacterium]|jgi:glycosyltransferase involved in cell wall biosynthesis|nr:glycosyltransferase family 2 protein [Thermoanaerobaculia bacterium]